MVQLKIDGIGSVEFDPEKLPVSLRCSSQCENAEGFRNANFLSAAADGSTLLLCSEANAAALGDYVCAYAGPSCLPDVCFLLNGKENYWRRLAESPAGPGGNSLSWELQALKIACGRKLHILTDENGRRWYVLTDWEALEAGPLPAETRKALESFCEEQVLAIFEDRYEAGDGWDAVLDFEGAGDWLKGVYLKFCSMHV